MRNPNLDSNPFVYIKKLITSILYIRPRNTAIKDSEGFDERYNYV